MSGDRVGLGWRPALAAAIVAHRGAIDVLEVLVWPGMKQRELAALRALARTVPVQAHATCLGLASASPVDGRRLDGIARAIDAIAPEAWSEHLAFVRAGGVEIGHLTAPPRCAATRDGLAANVARARAAVGAAPLLENIATLVEPPVSDRDEATWIGDAIAVTGCGLLLDLHNLHANAENHGFSALDALQRLPLAAVRTVHLSGGRRGDCGLGAGYERLIDDHRHDPPEPVYALLTALAARCPQPLTVIIERDGCYPPFPVLCAQLDRARAALAAGRAVTAANPHLSEAIGVGTG